MRDKYNLRLADYIFSVIPRKTDKDWSKNSTEPKKHEHEYEEN